MKRFLIVLALFLLLVTPALAITPRRGMMAGRPGDMALLDASWWSSGGLAGEGRGFVPTIAGRAELDLLRYSRAHGWAMTFVAPNIQAGANMTARETAVGLRRIALRWPYKKLVSPTFAGSCEDGDYNYGLSAVVAEYRHLYGEAPWFDAIGVQVAASSAEDAICRIEQVVGEARQLGYEDAEVWVVGFSCYPDTTDKAAYMRNMLDYINSAEITRYNWHPARPEPGVWYDWSGLRLIGDDGQLTELGLIYAAP
jgi:hypothetical protein